MANTESRSMANVGAASQTRARGKVLCPSSPGASRRAVQEPGLSSSLSSEWTLTLTSRAHLPKKLTLAPSFALATSLTTLVVSVEPSHTPELYSLTTHRTSTSLQIVDAMSSALPLAREWKRFAKKAFLLERIVWTGRGGVGTFEFAHSGRVDFKPLSLESPVSDEEPTPHAHASFAPGITSSPSEGRDSAQHQLRARRASSVSLIGSCLASLSLEADLDTSGDSVPSASSYLLSPPPSPERERKKAVGAAPQSEPQTRHSSTSQVSSLDKTRHRSRSSVLVPSTKQKMSSAATWTAQAQGTTTELPAATSASQGTSLTAKKSWSEVATRSLANAASAGLPAKPSSSTIAASGMPPIASTKVQSSSSSSSKGRAGRANSAKAGTGPATSRGATERARK